MEYVKQFRTEKTKDRAFAGRIGKRAAYSFPHDVDFLENLDRNDLLREMAKYKQIYAVGRTAIEAKILDCQLLPYDVRFPDVNQWQIMDNSEAVFILQKKLDELEGD